MPWLLSQILKYGPHLPSFLWGILTNILASLLYDYLKSFPRKEEYLDISVTGDRISFAGETSTDSNPATIISDLFNTSDQVPPPKINHDNDTIIE